MRRVLRTVATSGVPFGVFMGCFLGYRGGAAGGVVSGVVTGLTFGVVTAVFTELQRRRLQVVGPIDGEQVLHQGPANHLRRGEWRGGWLVLTPTRLLFRAHKVNVQKAPLEIPLASVRGVEGARTLGIVPNGVRVHLASGEDDVFVVSGRSEWIARLRAPSVESPA